MVQFFCFFTFGFFLCATAGGPGFRGKPLVAAAGMTSQALRASSPGRGAKGRGLSLGLPFQGRWLGGAETERSFQICDNLSVTFGDSFPGRGAFDRVVNATAADILAYLAVKRKKFYLNLTFF